MIRTLFYIIIITFVTSGLAQSTFQLSIEKNDSTSDYIIRHSITEGTFGDIYALGTTYPNNAFSKCRLIKISNIGDIIWDTTYSHTTSHEFAPDIMPTNDGGVLLVSDSYSYPIADEDTISDILVWKIDPQGNIQWQKVLRARDFFDVNTTKDGGFILLGSVHEANYYQGLDMIAYKIDANGNILWSKQLGQQVGGYPYEREHPISIKEIDNQIYICGYHSHDGWLELDGVMYALDSDGNLLWDIFIPNNSENNKIEINCVLKLKGELYFKANSGVFGFNPNTGSYWPVPSSLNIGLFGVFGKGYNFSVDCLMNEIEVLKEQPAGNYYLQLYENLLEPYYSKNILEITGFFTGMIATKDGGFLIFHGNGNMIITKMDCSGNVAFWSNECNSKVPDESALIIYPNPSQNEILIEAIFDFDEVIIISPNGQYISYDNSCSCPRYAMNISELAAGVYIVRISSNENFAISKFVKI